MSRLPIIGLMGPTASGKTPLAVKLVQHFPCEIISVDSAMIYRGMDIGTAKPDRAVLNIAPHRLIDILDPAEIYSAGQFYTDALREIEQIIARGNIPLLVGGTMLYFRVLQSGIAELPTADFALRQTLQAKADQEGIESLHQDLARIDLAASKRIHPNDFQRISRALEVFMLTGKTITDFQTNQSKPSPFPMHSLAISPSNRANLHDRIAARFKIMLEQGFIHEVEGLYQRGDLTADMPSMRSVGYAQVWNYLSGHTTYEDMTAQCLAATRQLAKRQMTWLRSWPDLTLFDSDAAHLFDEVALWIEKTR